MYNFDSLWNLHRDFEFAEEDQPDLCIYAQQFSDWAAELCEHVTQTLSKVSSEQATVLVNQAKILLQDKYFKWFAAVPQKHRNHIGTRNSHTCIFQVYVNAFSTLKAVELSLTPPLLFLPKPSPPPPPPPEIAGLFIGELDDE